MSTKYILLAALVANAAARFGQEHPKAIDEIGAVTSGGQPGQAATIAGGAISNLLAAANPCDKLKTGDNILANLGTGADAVQAAKDFVAAEQNFNTFTQSVPTICGDPTLPQNPLIRGIVPLVDPGVIGSDGENALSAQSLQTPFDATGKSVADVMAAQGFTNFTTKDVAGNAGPSPADGAASGTGATTSSSTGSAIAATNSTAEITTSADGNACAAPPTAASTASTASTSTSASEDSNSTVSTGSAIGTNDSSTSSIAGLNFGLCIPTIKFEGGLGGRPPTEFTFQAIDPKIQAIQQEALNPNIITNRICDELTNQCKANQAAKDKCQNAKAQISALGTRDRSTANAWNTALGFQGANTNPDGGPTGKIRMIRTF